MAINKRAKNIRIDINKEYRLIAGEVNITAKEIVIYSTKEDLQLISNKKIIISGNK